VLSTYAALPSLHVLENKGFQSCLQALYHLPVFEPFYCAIQVQISVPNVTVADHQGLLTYESLGLLNQISEVLGLHAHVEFDRLKTN